jgi:hypothetical protein
MEGEKVLNAVSLRVIYVNIRLSPARSNLSAFCTNHSTKPEITMRKLFPILLAALFAAVTFSAYSADESTQNTQPAPQKHTKKEKNLIQRPYSNLATRWTNRGRVLRNRPAPGACNKVPPRRRAVALRRAHRLLAAAP